MQPNANPFLVLILKVFTFCLDVFKNSQFVNFIIFCFFYFFIFFIIIAGVFFSFYAEIASKLIVWVSHLFFDISSNSSMEFNWEGETFIKYYLFVLFIFGIFQELVLIILEKIFNKKFRDILEQSKRTLFLILITVCLILEFAVSFLLKEWWISLVGIGSFVVLIIFYFWYRFVFKVVNKLKNVLTQIQAGSV